MRTIKQICADGATENEFGMVYALASDNTIWQYCEAYQEKWRQLPPIPNTHQTSVQMELPGMVPKTIFAGEGFSNE